MNELLNIINSSLEVQWFIIIFLGLFVGSFVNVLNYRLPKMEDYNNASLIVRYAKDAGDEIRDFVEKHKGFNFAFPPSACPVCDHKIKSYENIPILSYLFLRGKCSQCETKISIEYPIVELLHALLWVGAFYVVGFKADLFFILPLLTFLFSAIVIDLKHKIVFDTYHLVVLSLGLLYSVYGFGNIDPKDAVLTSVVSFFGIYTFVLSYETLRKFDGVMLGRGDIKLFGAMGAWIGMSDYLPLILLSSVIGIIAFIITKIFTSMSENLKDYQLPFVPSMVFAFVLILLNRYYNLIDISLI